jgi:iron complex outermembrane receptor protein
VPWLVNVGARYVHTEVRAQSDTRELLDLLPVLGDPTNYSSVYQNNGQFIPSNTSASYNAFLPNVNIKVELPANLIARFGVSRTITRPTLTDLRPVTTFDETRPSVLTASGGNPELLPYRAGNVDLSLEWYPTRTTTVAVAGYYKKINDYIVTTIENEVVPIQNAGGLPVGGFITGPNSATFATARPRNGGSAEIRGVELNLVHTFTWLPGFLSGFGTQLNATFVGTNRTFANLSPTERFAVVGLSNSQNATIFYEKYGVSARVAYNHRDKFLSSIANGEGAEPLFIRAYGQVDASVSFNVMPNVQLMLEGTNILNAKYIRTARFDNELRSYVNNGARADIGVRVNF